MLLTRWLVVVVLLWSAVASAQFVFSPTEEQIVSLTLNEIQQGLQRAKPGNLELPLGSTFLADGKQTDSAGVVASVNAMLAALPSRDIYASNPLPSKLGIFWDFQISEPTLEFAGDTCHVNCNYLLVAGGVRVGTGHIDFVKIGRGFRVARLDGLVPFLNQEVQGLKGSQRPGAKEK